MDDRERASAMAALFRTELRETRFSVENLVRGDTALSSDGSLMTTLQSQSAREVNGDGLRALHEAGTWQAELLRSEIRVEALGSGPAGGDRRARFESLLDGLGVVSDGHVAQALGDLLPGPSFGRIQPCSPDETIGIAQTEDLWGYLLIDACLGTPRRTAAKVLRWARAGDVAFETRAVLGLLRAEEPVRLANGITIERIPDRTENLGGWLPLGGSIAPSEYLGRTVLRVPCRIGPGLSKPKRVTRERGGTATESWKVPAKIVADWPLPPGGIHQLARALSLVCGVAVETPVTWADYGAHAWFGQRRGSSMTGTGELPPRHADETPLTTTLLKTALRLQARLIDPPADVATAIGYWLKSKARGVEAADALVYLRTALEVLFLDEGNQAELSFRLATHGAWYIGRNRLERRAKYDVLRNVYRAASAAVHAGRAKTEHAALLATGQEMCREAILKRLRSKERPNWREIVFGG